MSEKISQDVLQRLNIPAFYESEHLELRKHTNYWTARCPFHDDKQASLSIMESGYFKCHACGKKGSPFQFYQDLRGSDFPAALRAVAEFSGTRVPDARATERRVVATYEYTDERGAPAHRTVRTDPKGFFQQRYENGQWVNGLKSDTPVFLYHLPIITSAISMGATIFVVEGEKDADNLWSIEVPATSAPMGAGKWRASFTASLAGAKVVVLPDNDKAGIDHARLVADELVEAGCEVRLLTLPDLPEHGDVSDWLVKGHNATDLAFVARGCPEYRKRVRGGTSLRASGIIARQVEWLWEKWLPKGKLTILAGEGGVGKSWMSLSLAATISRGAAWPDGHNAPRGNVLIVAGEDDAEDTIVPRLQRLGADLERVFIWQGVDTLATDGHLEFLDLKKHMLDFEAHVREIRPLLVIMDPITAYLGNTDAHNNAEVRSVLDPLAAIAARHQVTVTGISHLNKSMQQQKSLDRLIGSVAFGAVSRVVMNMIEDPEDEQRRVVWVSKNNLAPKARPRALRLNGNIEWEPGELLNYDPEQILRAGAPKRDDMLDATIQFLEDELLVDIPIPSKEVLRHATENGISPATLTRAKQKMAHVRSIQKDRQWFMVKTGEVRTSDSLPVMTDHLDHLTPDPHSDDPDDQGKGTENLKSEPPSDEEEPPHWNRD